MTTARAWTVLATGALTMVFAASPALAVGAWSAPTAPVAPVASPPSPETMVTTTNAMLQPSQVPASLRAGTWSVMTMTPPGGQDPTPICLFGEMGAVSLSLADAVGYSAGYDQIRQQVYAYPSPARASRVWLRMERRLRADCAGTRTVGDQTIAVTTGRLTVPGGDPGWWVRSDVVRGTGSGSYLTVVPVGTHVQMISLYADNGNVPTTQRAAVDRLSRTLSLRLAQAGSLPAIQSPLLTRAQRTMMQPADIPAELPFTQPAKGGWSAVLSYAPGEGPWTCGSAQLPKGIASFENGFGGTGDVIAEPGDVDQRMEVYANADRARVAWSKLTTSIRTCDDATSPPISQTKPVSRRSSGTSALTFGGTAGVWSRTFDTNPDTGTCTNDKGRTVPCVGFSSKAYSIHLLVGDSIQTVTYYKTVDGVRQVPIDQAAVNALAEQLALRWAASAPTG